MKYQLGKRIAAILIAGAVTCSNITPLTYADEISESIVMEEVQGAQTEVYEVIPETQESIPVPEPDEIEIEQPAPATDTAEPEVQDIEIETVPEAVEEDNQEIADAVMEEQDPSSEEGQTPGEQIQDKNVREVKNNDPFLSGQIIGESDFPEDTYGQFRALTEEEHAALSNSLSSYLAAYGERIESETHSMDAGLYYSDGSSYTPTSNITVRLFLDWSEMSAERLFHLKEDGSWEELAYEMNESSDALPRHIEFETRSFSPFLLVKTAAIKDQEDLQEESLSEEIIDNAATLAEPKIFKYEDEKVIIQVSTDAENLIDTESNLVVVPIEESSALYQEYLKTVKEMYADSDAYSILPYDIHFEVDGIETEPSGGITTITYQLKEHEKLTEEEKASVVHISDNGEATEVLKDAAEDSEISDFTFDIDSLSGIVLVKRTLSERSLDPGDDNDVEIRKFTATITGGGSYVGKDYVYRANDNYADNHGFIFRLSYSVSGTYAFEPRTIEVRIPKTILVDREGNPADTYTMSLPKIEDSGLTDDMPYAYYEDGDEIVIVNRTEVPAGQAGYFEISYKTSKSTYNYADYKSDFGVNDKGASNEFTAHMAIHQGTSSATADTDPLRVYIDTTAKIEKVEKQKPSFHRSWNSSWGEEVKPENPEDYYYLEWPVRVFVDNVSQPYNLYFNDSFAGDGKLFLGYSYYNVFEDSKFHPELTVYDEHTSHPYGTYGISVLTAHSKAAYAGLDYYSIPNSITVTLEPTDLVDRKTTASGSATYTYEIPKFVHPTGHFYRYKWGLDAQNREVKDSNQISNYNLTDFQEGSENGGIDQMRNLRYHTEIYGYPYPWTIGDANNDGKTDALDADNPQAYGMHNVEYELIDNQVKIGNSLLKAGDYQIDSLSLGFTCEKGYYNSTTMQFSGSTTRPTEDDLITVYVQRNGLSEWEEAGVFSPLGGRFLSYEPDIASNVYGTLMMLNDNVTGYRLTTSNAYYYSKMSAEITLRLFRTENVLSMIDGLYRARIDNTERVCVYDHNGKRIYTDSDYGFVYSSKLDGAGYMHKYYQGMENDVKGKKVTVKWNVNAYEKETDPSGLSTSVYQTSGRFYDLLPKGATFKPRSLTVYADNQELVEGEYTYEVIENYHDSGRVMLVIDILEGANIYSYDYSTLHLWDSIKDYGKDLLNTAAYETGNASMYNGAPDSGGSVEEKELMKDLDPDTDARKFLYTQARCSADIVMSANTDLMKQVHGMKEGYSYSDITSADSIYSYRIRLGTDDTTKAKDLIIYDSLENYVVAEGVNAGKGSDWHGTFTSLDISRLREVGIDPVVYYSTQDNLSIDEHPDVAEAVWIRADLFTGNLSEVKAFAIDCRKRPNGSDFVLDKNSSITVTVYMRSPSASGSDKIDPVAYNNVYLQQTAISTDGAEDELKLTHQDFTRIYYRITGDVRVKKTDAEDSTKPVKGATYRLYGTSDYGDVVNMSIMTNKFGEATFKDIFRGSYYLKETVSTPDYFLDETVYQVTIDGAGDVYIDGEKAEDYISLCDNPRVHADFSFLKKGHVDGRNVSVSVSGVTFRLTGTSAYGNEVRRYATSNAGGQVTFGDIEKGSYLLEEISGSDDYIMNNTTWNVDVDDLGVVSIVNQETQEAAAQDGILPVIYNEPYHAIKIRKLDAEDTGNYLAGAVYSLTGTSDYGTVVNKESTSDGNGMLEFSHLEPGTYLLKEIKAPEHYELSETSIKVTVDSNGNVTGLENYSELNSAPEFANVYYIMDERKYEGVLEVTKVWEGDVKEGKLYRIDIYDENGEKLDGVYAGEKGLDLTKIEPTVLHTPNISDDGEMLTDFASGTYYSSTRFVSMPGVKKVHFSVDTHVNNGNSRGTFYIRNRNTYSYNYINQHAEGPLGELYHHEFDMDGSEFEVYFNQYGVPENDNRYSPNANYGYYITATATEAEMTEMSVSDGDTVRLTEKEMFDITDLPEGARYELVEIDSTPERPFPVVNLGKDDPTRSKSSSILDLRQLNSKLGTSLTKTVTGFKKADISSIDELPENAFSVSYYSGTPENGVVVPTFPTPTYAWVDANGCVRWWSEADNVYLVTGGSDYGSGKFAYWENIAEIDLNGLHGDYLDAYSLSNMFYGCKRLQKIRFGSLSTKNCTRMYSTFYGCSNLKDVDFYNMDTSNVWQLYYTFNGCTGFTNLDLSCWDMHSLRYIFYAFTGANNIKTLDLSGWDTSSLRYAYDGLKGMSQVEVIDISGWTFAGFTDSYSMAYMFESDPSLKTIYASEHPLAAAARTNSATYMCSGDRNLASNYGTGYGHDKYYSYGYPSSTYTYDTLPLRLDGYDDDYNYDPSYIGRGIFTAKNVISSSDEGKDTGYAVIDTGKLGIVPSPVSFSKSPLLSYEDVASVAGTTLRRIDDGSTAEKVWGYAVGRAIFWWSDADTVYLPENCSYFTMKLSSTGSVYGSLPITSISLDGLDGSRVKNADSFFDNRAYTSGSSSTDTGISSIEFGSCHMNNLVSAAGMFKNTGSCENLSIENVSSGKLENMKDMFGNSKITSLDLSSFNVSSVKDFSGMLKGSSVKELDLSGWDMKSWKNTADMLSVSSGFTKLVLNDFDPHGCLPGIPDEPYKREEDERIEPYMNDVFYHFTSDDQGSWGTVSGSPSIVYGLLYSDGTYVLQGDKTADTSHGTLLATVEFPDGNLVTTNYSTTWLYSRQYNGTRYSNLIKSIEIKTPVKANRSGCFEYLYSLESVSGLENLYVYDGGSMFESCRTLKSITGTPILLTSNLKNAFSGCSSLENPDLANWDVSGVTDMQYMFNNCTSITELDLSGWDARSLYSAYSMFSGCTSLKTIYASSNWNVSEGNSMFYNCTSLKTNYDTAYDSGKSSSTYARLDGYDDYQRIDETYIGRGLFTAKDVEELPYDDFALSENEAMISHDAWSSYGGRIIRFERSGIPKEELPEDAKKVDTGETDKSIYTWIEDTEDGTVEYWWSDAEHIYMAENSSSMFYGCSSLEELDITAFDSSRVVNCDSMFLGCSKLKSLDVSAMDVSKVKNMKSMFNSCSSLETLDISTWHPASVKELGSMFYGCSSLRRIYASEDLNGSLQKPSGQWPFNSANSKLATDNGTKYTDLDNATAVYAVIDGTVKDGKLRRGLLTYKADPNMSEPPADNQNTSSLTGRIQTSKSVKYEGDGDSSKVYEQWIDNGDGTWTYRFRVFDADDTYYAWEVDAPGYHWNEDESHPVRIDYTQGSTDSSGTVTNRKNPDDGKGHLAITKSLAGDQLTQEDLGRKFWFTITIEGLANGTYGSVKFTDGVGRVEISDKQTVYISDLPEDLSYTVEEDPVDGFDASISKASGKIVDGITQRVTATNTRQDWYGNLEIEKQLENNEQSAGEESAQFMFNVRLSGDGITGSQQFGDFLFNEGVGIVTVNAGETVTLDKIPGGTTYTIEEVADEEYNLVSSDNTEGEIITKETKHAVFKNEKIIIPKNGFAVTKRVLGVHTDEEFSFTAVFDGLQPRKTYEGPSGTFSATAKGTASVPFTLSDGETAVFGSLPVGSTYVITEDENAYIPAYTIVNNAEYGNIVKAADKNTAAGDILSTNQETVDSEEEIVITFENSVPSFTVPILKADEDGSMLPGATLSMLDAEGNVLYTWETTDSEMYSANVPAGTYTVSEVTAPVGYVLTEPVTVVVDDEGRLTVSGNTVSYVSLTDPSTEVTFSKKDQIGGYISGASLAVYNAEDVNEEGEVSADAEPVASWKSSGSAKTLTGILKAGGDYVLVELSAPYGYSIAEPVRFNVPTDGIGQVSMTDVYIANDITIRKTDENNANLSGAKIGIYNAENNAKVLGFTSSETDHVAGLLPGQYILKEEQTPDDTKYRYADDIPFEVTSDGKLIVSGEEATQLLMIDFALTHEVRVKKTDIYGSGLAGAVLTITGTYENGDEADPVSIESTGDWQNISLKAGTYTLTETGVPDYYVQADPINFTVDPDGTLKVDNQVCDGIVMENSPQTYDIVVSKQDVNGKELPGAEITISGRETGASEDIKPITWTSGSDGYEDDGTTIKPHAVSLKPGTYTLHEGAAPTGFKVITDVQFRVAADGTVSTLSSTTTGRVYVNKNGAVVIEDENLVHKLSVEKTVRGSMGNKAKAFNFELSLTGPYIPDEISYTKGEESGKLPVNEGKVSFTLTHGEKIVFNDLPYGTQYSVSETNSADYKVTKENDSGTITEDTNVLFTNTRGKVVPTLTDLGSSATAIIVFVAAFLMLMIVFFRRKRRITSSGEG